MKLQNKLVRCIITIIDIEIYAHTSYLTARNWVCLNRHSNIWRCKRRCIYNAILDRCKYSAILLYLTALIIVPPVILYIARSKFNSKYIVQGPGDGISNFLMLTINYLLSSVLYVALSYVRFARSALRHDG